MTDVPLPGLRARWPHQWMAALGALRLLPDTRLRWDDDERPVLVGPHASLVDVAARLAAVVDSIPSDAVLPGMTDWPPAKHGTSGRDPALEWPPQPPTRDPDGWWSACLAQDVGARRLLRSPYIGRRGQQTLRHFFGQPLSLLRDQAEAKLRRSLSTGWRVLGYTAEQLDASAYVEGAGGDPAATWLAAMALPLLGPVSVVDGQPVCPGWETPATMLWPVWSQPLDTRAVRELLAQPGWMPGAHLVGDVHLDFGAEVYGGTAEIAREVRRVGWTIDHVLAAGYGVTRVYQSRRTEVPGQKYDRPLAVGAPVPWRSCSGT